MLENGLQVQYKGEQSWNREYPVCGYGNDYHIVLKKPNTNANLWKIFTLHKGQQA